MGQGHDGGGGIEGECGCVLMGGDAAAHSILKVDNVSNVEKLFGGGIELRAGVFDLGHYTLL